VQGQLLHFLIQDFNPLDAMCSMINLLLEGAGIRSSR
jgi:hypothetical protein